MCSRGKLLTLHYMYIYMYLSPSQRMARIVALPEPHVAVLQLSSDIKGFTGGPPDSYFYTDPRGLVWDSRLGHWTKDDLAADLSVGRLHPGKKKRNNNHINSYITSFIQSNSSCS